MIFYSLSAEGYVLRQTVIGEVVKLIDTTEIKLSPHQAKKKKKKTKMRAWAVISDLRYLACLYCEKVRSAKCYEYFQ